MCSPLSDHRTLTTVRMYDLTCQSLLEAFHRKLLDIICRICLLRPRMILLFSVSGSRILRQILGNFGRFLEGKKGMFQCHNTIYPNRKVLILYFGTLTLILMFNGIKRICRTNWQRSTQDIRGTVARNEGEIGCRFCHPLPGAIIPNAQLQVSRRVQGPC